MKCCLHRPHLGLDGGLGYVARVGADGSRTVGTIASPTKTDTKWCQLKIIVPPLPSKLKFSNPAKKASMHWLTYGMLSHSGAAKRQWSGGAPRRGASAWPAWRRAGAGHRTSGPAWRRGGAGRRAEAAGRRGVGARRRGTAWPRGVAAGVATGHGEMAARRGRCRC